MVTPINITVFFLVFDWNEEIKRKQKRKCKDTRHLPELNHPIEDSQHLQVHQRPKVINEKVDLTRTMEITDVHCAVERGKQHRMPQSERRPQTKL